MNKIIVVFLFFIIPATCYAGPLSLNRTLWETDNFEDETSFIGFYNGKVWLVEGVFAVDIQSSKYTDYIVFSVFEMGDIVGILVSWLEVGYSQPKGQPEHRADMRKYSDQWTP